MEEEKDYKRCQCALDMGRGCEFCECNEEIVTTPCQGCFKLHSTDWLKDYPDALPTDIFEVRFKNTRRSYYRNVNDLPLAEGDIVAVEASPGHDIGIISLTGDMVARQMRRVGFNPQNGEFKKIYRKAKPYDIEKWREAMALEQSTMIRARQIAAEMNLNMKIGDVEYQGDKIKAIFYYIADERVDFRELIKVFAEEFRIRIEMKQIGARQEAGRIGGLGSCGRELCCASWISNFVSVTTNAARTQDISLNPQKLAGQCSKLKCCMIYEIDGYIEARKEFPHLRGPLQALDGDYFWVKNDILARTMSFSSAPNAIVGMITLPIKRVKEIMELNAKGVKIDRIEPDEKTEVAQEEPQFVNVIGEESITRFDKKKKKKGNNNGGNGGNNNRQRQGGPNQSREASPTAGNASPKKNDSARPDSAGSREDGNRNRSEQNRRPQGRRPEGQQNRPEGQQGQQGQPNRSEGQPNRSPRPAGQNGQNGQGGQNRNRNNQNRNRGGQNRGGQNPNAAQGERREGNRPRGGAAGEGAPQQQTNGQPKPENKPAPRSENE